MAPVALPQDFWDEHDPLSAHVVSMWVAPAYRRTGTGSLLVDAVQTWARTRGVYELRLMVTSRINRAAIAFYGTQGFSLTGNTEPYPNDPSVIEYEMSSVASRRRYRWSRRLQVRVFGDNVPMDKIAMLNEILMQNPNDAFARYGLAMEYAGRGETGSPPGRIRAFLEEHPDYTAGYFMAAQTLAKADRTDEAKNRLTQGIASARRTGNQHAQSEMQAMLDELELAG